MANMAGILSPLDHAIHILDAAYLMDGLYIEAVNCVLELYGIDVLYKAWEEHLDKVLLKIYE